MITVGKEIVEKTDEILEVFQPVEGFNYVYYGRIRNGKTYAAVADIIELLNRGEVVFANWQINFKGFDQRESILMVIMKFLTKRDYFYCFHPENFHYFDSSDPKIVEFLNKLVGVHIFVDEGQWLFNSHLKTDDPDKRRLILEGGHYCRSLYVITQRPQNIMKDIRSQIHVWYKCEKVFQFGNIIRFIRTEIQDMKDDIPDEDNPNIKYKVKAYWASKRIFNSYNTHAMRRNDAIRFVPSFDVYQLNWSEKVSILMYRLVPKALRRRRRQHDAPAPVVKKKEWSLSDVKEKREGSVS